MQPDLDQELQPVNRLGQQVASNFLLTLVELNPLEELQGLRQRQLAQLGSVVSFKRTEAASSRTRSPLQTEQGRSPTRS